MIPEKSIRSQKRWRRIQKNENQKAEAFLRAREKTCVTACSRFIRQNKNNNHVWKLGEEGKIYALLLHFQRTLYPVFGAGDPDTGKGRPIPGPRFLSRFLGKVKIHAIQGLRDDAITLENLRQEQGYFAAERIDYYLMDLDDPVKEEAFLSGPRDLVLRPPVRQDTEALLNLQISYEREEVLPANSQLNPAASRLNLDHILSREQVLLAELDGKVVGKINTSAESFTRRQIGGVYVVPLFRGMGIGLKMCAVFSKNLLVSGKGLTLFVKKRNAAAIKVYTRAGFKTLADYRITYY